MTTPVRGAQAGLKSANRDGSVTGEDSIVSGVAGRYANALFELAGDAGSIDSVGADLDGFTAAIAESADLARFVKSPVISAEEQAQTLEVLLPKLKVSDLTSNFLRLLAKNRRLSSVGDVAKAYSALVAAKRGAVTAEVTSAEPLSEAQTDALKSALKASTGKDIEVRSKVDSSLIGGLVVKMGSRMIDTSLKTKLNQLKITLKEVG